MAALPRTFPKSTATRAHSVLAAALLGGLLVDLLLSAGPAPWLSVVLLGGLTALSVLFMGSAFGDRYVLSDGAVTYENRWLTRVGVGKSRRLRFDDIASLREHRSKTLFLKDRAGRRFVIDAVADYVELRDHILHARPDLSGDAAKPS